MSHKNLTSQELLRTSDPICTYVRPMLAVNADGAVELHFSLFFCATLAAALAWTLQSNARQRAVDVDFCGLLKVSWA